MLSALPRQRRPIIARENARPLLSIVLPARNEAAGIRNSLLIVHEYLIQLGISFEIIVGDSASTDGTGVMALSAEVPLRVVRVDQPGKGLVLSRAMLSANGSLIGFLDSDLEISVEYLEAAISAVLAGADGAIGSKALDPAFASTRPAMRRLVTCLANWFIRGAVGTNFRDHQAGMKVFRREALIPVLRSVRTTGWLWDTELLARMSAAGAHIQEIPVRAVAGRPSSFGSIKQLASAAFDLLRVCASLRLSPYRLERATLIAAE